MVALLMRTRMVFRIAGWCIRGVDARRAGGMEITFPLAEYVYAAVALHRIDETDDTVYGPSAHSHDRVPAVRTLGGAVNF